MQPSTKNSEKCNSPILFRHPNVHVLLMGDIINLSNFKQKGLFYAPFSNFAPNLVRSQDMNVFLVFERVCVLWCTFVSVFTEGLFFFFDPPQL